MSRYAIKFPFRVRIHGGEFDESARAIHREDGLKTIQAESGIVLESTIERKQMSTKTTFKRIALVAVAAVGFGTLSVAPSTASVNAASLYFSTPASIAAGAYADFSSTSTNILLTGSAVIGLQHSFVASAASDAATIDVKLTQNVSVYPNTNAALPVQTRGATAANNTAANNANTTTAISADGMTMTTTATAAGLVVGSLISTFTPTVAGTYIVTFTAKSGGSVDEVFTWTVNAYATQAALDTANGVDNVLNVAKTTSFINTGETTTATADATVIASKALVTSAAATIVVAPKNAAGTAISNVTFPLTVTVSGPGTVAVGTNLAAITALDTGVGRAVTGTTGHYVIGVFADGTAGVSTITVSSGTTEIAKETVTFYGSAATITPTVVNSVLNIGLNSGAVTAIVKDAAGVPVYNVPVYAISDTAATIDNVTYQSCGSSDATGLVTCPLTGVAVGTAKITLSLNSSSAGTSTVSAVAGTMRVSSGTPTKVSYAFDKDTYAPGETAKITATVSDAVGVLGAGTYTVLTAAVTGNYSIAGLPGTTTVVAVGSTGQAVYTVTIPTGVSGTLKLTGTAVSTVTATYGQAEVVNAALVAAQEATDAANEATDAGNNAKDAADQAIEAADAATIAAQDAAAAAELAGEVAVAAAEAAGEIAQEALDAANAATDAALSAAEAADAATAAATEAKESADAATAAVAALSAEVAKLMADLNLRITKLGNTLATILKKLTK